MIFQLQNLIQGASTAAMRTSNMLDMEARHRIAKRSNLSKVLPFTSVKSMIMNLDNDKFEDDLFNFCVW